MTGWGQELGFLPFFSGPFFVEKMGQDHRLGKDLVPTGTQGPLHWLSAQHSPAGLGREGRHHSFQFDPPRVPDGRFGRWTLQTDKSLGFPPSTTRMRAAPGAAVRSPSLRKILKPP